MTGHSPSDGSAERRSWWSTVPVLVRVGALSFGAFWFSIALTMLSYGDRMSLGRSVGLSGALAAVLTLVLGVVWELTAANQWRLDREEARRLARHPGVAPAHPDQFSVDVSEGGAPRCVIAGRRLEYRWSEGRGYSVSHTLEICSDGRSLLTATSPRDPHVLDAMVLRSGLEGTVLDLPLTMKLRRRGPLRRQRRIDITIGDRALRYTWGRSRPILIRGTNPDEVILRPVSDEAYEILGPVSEHEQLVAATLALGTARQALQSPVWGLLKAILDGI